MDLFIEPNIKEIHLGGGTPSHLTTEELKALVNHISKFVKINDLKEFAMEIDPRTVNYQDFDTYANLGVDRISFGVQDFDAEVQKKINRIQPFELIESLIFFVEFLDLNYYLIFFELQLLFLLYVVHFLETLYKLLE